MNLINNEWNEYLSRQESCNVSQILTQESKKHAASTKNPSRLSVNTPLQKHDNVIDGPNENIETMYSFHSLNKCSLPQRNEFDEGLLDKNTESFTRESRGNKSSLLQTGGTDSKSATSDTRLHVLSNNDPFCSTATSEPEDFEYTPKCEDLYISTKTKVLFLNKEIDINTIFWNIPIIEYWKAEIGIVKKQMKIVSKNQEEFDEYKKRLETIPYYVETIIKQINNPAARRIKFKDERKITVGVSKKDIMNCRGKVKNAFYNCFALIFRFKYEGNFREIHVKIFNTGKMEIPGVLNSEILDTVKEMVLNLLKPNGLPDIGFIEVDSENNVLINSNFNCGYYINREKIYACLRSKKYGIETAYDPCSYPGVKCKFYFNHEIGFDVEKQTGRINEEDRSMKKSQLMDNVKYTEVSFMIFRTGSCLIVGNCTEKILKFIFDFIKKMLKDEYQNIYVVNTDTVVKIKKNKIRKKNISLSTEYYSTVTNG